MGYLDESAGFLGGILPTAHGDVHVVVGPAGDDNLFVSYAGTLPALLSVRAIDPHMTAAPDPSAVLRDGRLRPYQREELDDGTVKFTRWFAAVKSVADLPALGGRSPLHVDTLKPRSRRMRLIINERKP